LEQLAERRGTPAAEFEALKEEALSAKRVPTESDTSNYRKYLSAAAQQIRIEKGLTQREVARQGKIPVALVQGIEDNSVSNFTHYELYRLGYGLGLKPLAEVAELLQRVADLQQLATAETQTASKGGALHDESEGMGSD
jgi:transcriptional regulator with XRE-family HTH domain